MIRLPKHVFIFNACKHTYMVLNFGITKQLIVSIFFLTEAIHLVCLIDHRITLIRWTLIVNVYLFFFSPFESLKIKKICNVRNITAHWWYF